MSTVTAVQMVAPQAMLGSDASYFKCPASTTAKIGRAIFYNSDSLVHTITVNVTTGGGATTPTTLLVRSVAPGETYVSPELAGVVIPPISELRGTCDTTAVVNIEVSGVTIV